MATYKKKLPPALNNGIGVFMRIMSGKWKVILLYHIAMGNNRPGELQRRIQDADRRVLNNQLNELITDGLITKIAHDSRIPKVEYQITSLGASILPLICELHKWGEANQAFIESGVTGT